MATKKTTTKKTSASRVSAPIKVSQSAKAEMRKWEIESDLNTLKRADDIRKDAKRMRDIQNLAKEQMNVLKNFSK
jgi:hypothetical protein